MSLFSDHAAELGKPYWWEHGAALPSLPESLPQSPATTPDLLIVGAGYTGLSAAIAAHDAGASVVVVDALVPGIGASTRNGGMFGPHPRLSYARLVAAFGEATARGIFNESQAAFDFTSGLIERENIACQFQQTGRIQLAYTRAHFAEQQRQVKAIKAVADMPLEIMTREEVTEDIQTEQYFGGIRFPNHAALHPRQFHDGLLASVLERGVRVIQNCPIASVTRNAATHTVTSQAGQTCKAGKVLMATNGYTSGGAYNWFTRRVFPLPSYLIATEPLSANQLHQLAPGARMMVETRGRHSYFRISPDGSRILFGGRAAMRPTTPEKAATSLYRTMTEIWPELDGVKLTHSWSGNTGYTFTHMPHVGVHDGVHFSMGYSGSGVAVAPYLGMKAAYQAIGDSRGETAYSNTAFKTAWHYRGGTPHFLLLAQFWYNNVVDKLEMRSAKSDRRSQG